MTHAMHRRLDVALFAAASLMVSGCATPGGWRIDPGVGGGFAGLRVPVVAATQTFDCAAGVCAPSTDVVRMKGDYQYQWRPAVTTTAVIRASDVSNWGLGINLVAAPVTDKATRLAPALTVHFVREKSQVFGGFIFMPSDALDLPKEGMLVPRGTDPNTFIRSGGATKANFLLGIAVSPGK